MASSPLAIINCPHHVFLSFRGEDVRKRFRSHFLKELSRKLIVFKDDEMERGRSIDSELIQAIQGSKISVVAFSQNFASSSWCLDELVEIMKCREERGLIVIPIFYDVDPSHVKKQSHSFGEIFDNTCQTCQGRTEEDKLQWRRALKEAATIVGEDSRNWPDESKMIETIVNDISNKLNPTKSSDFADFVGIEDHINNMISLMDLKSEEVITVGVWGPSGVGKTSIGRALFDQLSCQFLPSVFIDKTKKNFTGAKSDDYNTHLFLQTQFLAEALDQKGIKVSCLGAVGERLKHKRVLVVFDDMDDQVPLEAWVRKTAQFGPRSRVVVISEDRQFLRACGIELDRIYEVALPSGELAFHMFCRCAFGQDSPPDGFLELTIEAVNLAGNFPLCLNVLGSSLKGMKKEEWEDRLPEFRICMAEQIDKALRDSYDRLKEEDKAIFRHIACFFNDKTCDYMTRLLEDSELNVDVGLVTLAERCLIQISEDNNIRMHDFLQELGREIVRQPYIQAPGKREFLLDSKEICDVLLCGTGTESVLGIFLKLSEINSTLSISEEAFSRMTNLRFLRIYGVSWEDKEIILQLGRDEDHMWHQLRLLEWWACSMKRMPSNFRAENLVELIMPDSNLKKLWGGVALLNNLKKMDLRRSKNLKVLPDLSTATNLEELCLEDCWNLRSIPSSIRYLKKLRKLDMKRCKSLWDLPYKIDLESVHSLNFSGCSKLESFPQIARNISHLVLDGTKIKEVPCGIEDISGLNFISMVGCINLKYISPNFSKLKHLEVMFFGDSDSLAQTTWNEPSSEVATTTDDNHDLLDAFASRNWKTDVFVNILGSDVQETSLNHLFKELYHKGITTFKEDEITTGQEDLTTCRVNGIRESRIAIAVLSNNYASSGRCLDELMEIIKCGEQFGQILVPVFYGVDLVHIRNQILDLGETFKERYTVDNQQKWLQAFTELNQHQGYHIHTQDWYSEAEMIEKLAVDISLVLSTMPMILDEETVKTLNMHYNDLKWEGKVLFNLIACFLNNETYENVMQLLEDSELDFGGCLEILCEKCLLQISEERVISMHPVLQKLGRKRILRPFANQLAHRQFLMDISESCDLLIDQNCISVFGISFGVSEMEERLRRDERFRGMERMKFIRMYKDSLHGKEIRVHFVKGVLSLWHRLRNI